MKKKGLILAISLFLNFKILHATVIIDDNGNVNLPGNVKVNGKAYYNDSPIISTPIGSIIDWWQPQNQVSAIPDRFQLCDGSVVNDPQSPYNGQNLPNLINKFTRGVTRNNLGQTGGNDYTAVDQNTELNPDHFHDFNTTGKITNRISENGYSPGQNLYLIQNVTDWTTQAHIMVDSTLDSTRSGNHYHEMPATDPVAGHNHHIYSRFDTIPAYLSLIKIMRIK